MLGAPGTQHWSACSLMVSYPGRRKSWAGAGPAHSPGESHESTPSPGAPGAGLWPHGERAVPALSSRRPPKGGGLGWGWECSPLRAQLVLTSCALFPSKQPQGLGEDLRLLALAGAPVQGGGRPRRGQECSLPLTPAPGV